MKKSVAIIGGGPSALALAAFLDTDCFDVAIYERNKAFGRKFLVAGKGGFNLTHSEPMGQLLSRYSDNPILKNALSSFSNSDFRDWLQTIGIPTFVGSSKRVYPEKGIKPIEVLNAILSVLESKSVHFYFDRTWTGWNEEDELTFNTGAPVKADIVVFALGGASWKVTGSDGSWLDIFQEKGIETVEFLPSNCAYQVDWNQDFIQKNEGQPLKNIALSCSEKSTVGELVITQFGLEGNAIYALSGKIQELLTREGKATIYLDMKPTLSEEVVLDKLNRTNRKTSDLLRKHLKLSKSQIDLIKSFLSKEEFMQKETLAHKIKHFPLTLTAAASIDEAISTTGGISMRAINEQFELHQLPTTYCIGEMLDWNAPTGGYLLQACFSMGVFLARALNEEN